VICNDGTTYQMCVVGHLDDRWSDWLGDFTIARSDDGTCTLTGQVVDQAQLHGILARLRDIGATLVSLRTLDGDEKLLTAPRAAPTRDPVVLQIGDCSLRAWNRCSWCGYAVC
jgi:hypothetical protein